MNPHLAYALSVVFFVSMALVFWEGLIRPALLRPFAEFRSAMEIVRIRRQNRALIEREQKRLEGLKATVVSVGDMTMINGVVDIGQGWEFDCRGEVPVHRVDAKGTYRYCGYSRDDLIEIYKRRDEFANRQAN